jgi:hypothetical protein
LVYFHNINKKEVLVSKVFTGTKKVMASLNIIIFIKVSMY